ncbi:hypothetical protein [Saccharibacillus alkalitolerans]|uniref:Uncharacterized protein n=1 Tax=Saccharibacillus alkalitolerans TaxID=2705290 RepID=A0ABX0FCU5_9BACL|nr:hypothetical protein [Saccharibacillus alkalitolerans]NGZ78223.1 hypothetical protein [Saccharibacillus alkalitolerans]
MKNGGNFLFIFLLTLVLCLSPAILKDADPIDLDEALDNLNSADTGVGLLPSGLSSFLWMSGFLPVDPVPAPAYDPFFPLHAVELLIGWAVLLHLKRMLLRPLKFLSNYVDATRFSSL